MINSIKYIKVDALEDKIINNYKIKDKNRLVNLEPISIWE